MKFESWGEVPYAQATDRQLKLVQSRIEDEVEDTLVFCTHPRVVTLGRGTDPSELMTWKGEICESSRGGKATFHGPCQVVVYPILKLQHHDVLKYLDWLEAVTVKTLQSWKLPCKKSREAQLNLENKKMIPTGVWVQDRKIASIGVAVKKWVTYHGVAINLYEDSEAFTGINPCGFSADVMTSIEKELGKKIDREEFIEAFKSAALQTLLS